MPNPMGGVGPLGGQVRLVDHIPTQSSTSWRSA